MSDDTPTTATRRRVIAAAVVLVVLIGGSIGAVAARRAPERPDGLVILYGDSLGSEASGAFTEELTRTTDAEVVVRARPGIAPCDARSEMTRDLDLDPAVVVLQFVGNNGSACARGLDGEVLTGPALVERTLADVQTATEMFADRGIRVVLVGGPDTPGLPTDGASLAIAEAYNGIVDTYGGDMLGRVRYADAAAAVSGPDNAYADRLPCRSGEGEADGCENGTVAVRSPDRIHFCPVAHEGLACPVPAPGARRFGEAMAEAVGFALDPQY
jgi:hypothetical protein